MGWIEAIITIVGITIVVGSAIGNAMKESQAKRERQRAELTGRSESGSSSRPSLDDLAARRRQQLQEMARQRRESSGGGSRMSSSDRSQPGNMTAGEARERAEARAAYEQRAAALRQRREQAERSAAAERQREEARRAQQAAQQRQRELARQREALRQRRAQQQQQVRSGGQRSAARPTPSRSVQPTGSSRGLGVLQSAQSRRRPPSPS